MDSHQQPLVHNKTDDQKAQFEYEIKEIEKRLDKGCYIAFRIWIWLVMLAAWVEAIEGISSFASQIALFELPTISIMHYLVCPVLVISLCLYERRAIHYPDLETAQKAIKFMRSFVLAYVFLRVFLISYISRSYRSYEDKGDIYKTIGLVVQMAVMIIGGYKVKNLLEEREVLVQKVEGITMLDMLKGKDFNA